VSDARKATRSSMPARGVPAAGDVDASQLSLGLVEGRDDRLLVLHTPGAPIKVPIA
jgi:hypothetical protein